jgi:hypothetical protein
MHRWRPAAFVDDQCWPRLNAASSSGHGSFRAASLPGHRGAARSQLTCPPSSSVRPMQVTGAHRHATCHAGPGASRMTALRCHVGAAGPAAGGLRFGGSEDHAYVAVALYVDSPGAGSRVKREDREGKACLSDERVGGRAEAGTRTTRRAPRAPATATWADPAASDVTGRPASRIGGGAPRTSPTQPTASKRSDDGHTPRPGPAQPDTAPRPRPGTAARNTAGPGARTRRP